jgi:hypothetical protein
MARPRLPGERLPPSIIRMMTPQTPTDRAKAEATWKGHVAKAAKAKAAGQRNASLARPRSRGK